MALQHLRSSTASKRPTPAAMSDGQLALNTNDASPGLFFKDSNGGLVKVGPVHVGTTAPNASPASGGATGNTKGEQWLDTSGTNPVLKIWDGSAWQSEAGEFVNASGDVMTGALGIIAGSAGSPGLYFSGDTNTGIYSPGADQVAISANSSERIRIGANGEIGIGGANYGTSGQVLTSGGSGAAPSWQTLSVSANSITQGNTTAEVIDTGSDGRFVVTTEGTERLRVDSSGRLGLGTSSPVAGAQLTVAGSALAVTGQNLDHSANSIRIGQEGSGAAQIRCYGPNTSTNGSLTFKMSRSDGTNSQDVVIDGSGRLGIGTSTFASGAGQGTGVTAQVNGSLYVYEGNNSGGHGGAIAFGVNAWSTYTPMAQIKGLLTNAPGSEQQGDLAFYTRPTGVAGQTLQERLRITEAGRVGIGSTAPIAATHIMLSDVTGFSSPANDGLVIERGGGNDLGITIATNNDRNGYLLFADSDSSNPGWIGYDHSVNAMSFRVNASERARIDSSGRLLVGTSSARTNFSNSTDDPQLQIESANGFGWASIRNSNTTGGAYVYIAKSRGTGNVILQNNDIIGGLNFEGNDGSEFVTAAQIKTEVDGTPGSNDMPGRLVFSTTADGASSPTERMRITSAGALSHSPCSGSDLVGTEACGFVGDGIYAPVYKVKSALTSLKNCAIFANGNGVVGNIQMSGSSTAYNTSSDYRLKENITAVTDGIVRLQQLKPSRFNFLADPNTTVDGFIAHEVQAVVPEAISGSKDAVDGEGNPIYQGIDQSKLVPLLTAALQEAVAKIESLEARLTAAGI